MSKILLVDDGNARVSLLTSVLGRTLKERILIPAQRAGYSVYFVSENPTVQPDFRLGADLVLAPTEFKRLDTVPQEELKSFRIQAWPQDKNALEKFLLRSLIKDTEGFMSQHVERKISLAVTRLILPSGISPNTMTLISISIGIVGSFFFLSPQKWYHVAAALLFWLHSVLDGCDGEIARLKFVESRWGGILDFWGDNVVHSFVFALLAVGSAAKLQSSLYIFLGMSAVLGTVLSAFWTWWHTMRRKKDSEPVFTTVVAQKSSETSREKKAKKLEVIADFLARRDFIYLVIFLALIGKTEIFLWMSAIGSPIYFLVLVYFYFRKESL